MGVVLVVLSSELLTEEFDYLDGVLMAVIMAVVVGSSYPKLNSRLAMRSLRKLAADGTACPLGPVRLTLTDEGLIEEASGTTTQITWQHINEFHVAPEHCFVFTTPFEAMIVRGARPVPRTSSPPTASRDASPGGKTRGHLGRADPHAQAAAPPTGPLPPLTDLPPAAPRRLPTRA